MAGGWRTLLREGAALRVADVGEGLPFVFQHGLGGDAAQVAQNDPPEPAHRRLTLECRAHGGSQGGDSRPFSIAMFADDVLAAADQAGIGRFIAGGISMGAAIALRLAVRHPERVAGLVIVRPAWVVDAAPDNMAPFVELADLILSRGAEGARAIFSASATAARLELEAPDNLASLLGFCARDNAPVFAQAMRAIASDGPGVGAADVAAIRVPTLVIGTALDLVHPLASASALAAMIPGSLLCEAVPKSLDKNRHFHDVRTAIGAFLAENLHHRDFET